ncbi:ankyrin repeat-containing domain protein [Pavlovales sp. CCMP2436]|nr:ankyrin repeat-containing domain protein [Pavlovales sp. CCMP2436]
MREATRINVLAELAKQKKSGIVPEVIRHRQSFLPEVVELDSLREGKRRARQASISFLDACTLGDGKAIAQALEAGVNVQVSDDRGEGALHNWARATTGDADSARTAAELLKAGIDIDYQDHHGKTAAHFAAEYGHSKMLAWLYAKGANMHLTTVDGWTVLHEAVFKGDKASIDMLLHMVGGPDINARDASARTALHIAAYRCDEEVLLALINNGADPSINDKSSLFPEDLARRAHRSGSVNMLKGLSVRRASAEPNT